MKQSDNFSLNIPAGSPAECFRQSLRISAKDFEHKEPETPAKNNFAQIFLTVFSLVMTLGAIIFRNPKKRSMEKLFILYRNM